MQTVSCYGTFEEVLAASDAAAQETARALRALIADVYPEVVEVPWPNQRVAGYGLGPKKMTEHFCYLAAQRRYVNLGFKYGAALPDPEGLLEGPGRLMRHVKVATAGEAERPALRRLLEAALAERQAALGLPG